MQCFHRRRLLERYRLRQLGVVRLMEVVPHRNHRHLELFRSPYLEPSYHSAQSFLPLVAKVHHRPLRRSGTTESY